MHTILRKTWLIVIWFLCNNLIDAETDKITVSYGGVQNADGLVAISDGEYIIAGSLAAKPLQPGAYVSSKRTANWLPSTPEAEISERHPCPQRHAI